MKIERPDWTGEITRRAGGCGVTMPHGVGSKFWFEHLNDWFDEHVDPINKMLESGVEVRGYGTGVSSIWYDHDREPPGNVTHKALLINIEPIKQETCADVLKDWKKWMEDCRDKHGPDGFTDEAQDMYERAKAALERENEK